MKIVAALHPERRGVSRRALSVDGTITNGGNEAATVLVEDLSIDGFMMVACIPLAIGQEITVTLPGIGERVAVVVRRAGVRFGCRFAVSLDLRQRDAVVAAWLEADGVRRHRMLSGWRPGIDAFAA